MKWQGLFVVIVVAGCVVTCPRGTRAGICQDEVAERSQDTGSLLENAGFQWKGNRLPGWNIEKGAGNGPRTSTIRKGSDGSLELSGRSNTQTWNLVGQQVQVEGGDYLMFSWSGKATGLRREAGQFDNCWAGVWFFQRGKEVARNFFRVTRNQYVPESHVVRAPQGTTHARVMFFLSKTGKLNIRDVALRRLEPADSFQTLVQQMDRYYSYFEHKQIDWEELTARYAGRAQAASDNREFEKVVLEMLAELKDGHVWVIRDGQRLSEYRPPAWKPNFDFAVVDRELKQVKRFGRLGLVARTAGDLGYVRITSLQSQPAEMQKLIAAVDGLFDTDGLIIDLRRNGGGSEEFGKMLASVFCRKPVVYAKQNFRLNERHDEFYEHIRTPVTPRQGKIYRQPVACLIGPGAVSSAEGTALMFAALPNVTTIGLPTRGSTGNPQPVLLPNGVEVWFSRWVAMSPDGTPIEDRGVQPDIVVQHDAGDPAWERAKAELKK